MANYVEREDVETYLNVDLTINGGPLVDSLCDAVTAFTNSYCNRFFANDASTDIVEIFDGGDTIYFPKQVPVASIVSITDDGQALNAADIYNYGSYIKLTSLTAPGNRTVVITYRSGQNTLPLDLKQALVQWVADMFKSSDDSGKQVTRWGQGPVNAMYKQEGDIPDFVLRVLDKYRLPSI